MSKRLESLKKPLFAYKMSVDNPFEINLESMCKKFENYSVFLFCTFSRFFIDMGVEKLLDAKLAHQILNFFSLFLIHVHFVSHFFDGGNDGRMIF